MSAEAISHFATAYGAIRKRLGSHTTRSSAEGLEIHRPGWPVLLLTYGAAKDFAQQVEEAGQP
jgi:hypothetical protein